MRLIAIAGVAGAGKDAVKDFICELAPKAAVVRFADPIKEATRAMFDRPGYRLSRDQLYGSSEMRNKQIGDLVATNGMPLTTRYVLQTLGTECGRRYWGRDIWAHIAVRTAQAHAEQGALVVIPDCRFVNEMQIVRAANGALWHVERPGAGLPQTTPRWPWVGWLPARLQAQWMLGPHASERDIQPGGPVVNFRTAHLHNSRGLPWLRTLVEAELACTLN